MINLKKCFIEVSTEGYVIGWSEEKYSDNMIEVLAEESLFGVLGCVKYENNTLTLDKEKQEEISKNIYTPENAEKEITELKKENENLKLTLEKTQEDVTNTQMAVTDLFEMIENLA